MIGVKTIIYLYYHEDENFFTDDSGHILYDLFTIITPQDLFMFRSDRGYSLFPMVGNPDILCEILTIPDEICGLQEMLDSDLGDDYERIERCANANTI